jgi:hypothetical protein
LTRRRLLVAVSGVQLVLGVAGMRLAIGRGHPYHVPLLHGRPENVKRDSMLMGTALSAPVVMLAGQGVATARLAREDSEVATTALGTLGALMVSGYLGESLVRRRLRPSGWERVESPLALAGISLAALMAGLGLARD